MGDGRMVTGVLAVETRAISEGALVCLTQQGVERLILARAQDNAGHAKGDHALHALDWIWCIGRHL